MYTSSESKTDENQLRFACLDKAIQVAASGNNLSILKTAKAFYDFVKDGTFEEPVIENKPARAIMDDFMSSGFRRDVNRVIE